MLKIDDFTDIQKACSYLISFVADAEKMDEKKFQMMAEFYLSNLSQNLDDLRGIYKERLMFQKVEKAAE